MTITIEQLGIIVVVLGMLITGNWFLVKLAVGSALRGLDKVYRTKTECELITVNTNQRIQQLLDRLEPERERDDS